MFIFILDSIQIGWWCGKTSVAFAETVNILLHFDRRLYCNVLRDKYEPYKIQDYQRKKIKKQSKVRIFLYPVYMYDKSKHTIKYDYIF